MAQQHVLVIGAANFDIQGWMDKPLSTQGRVHSAVGGVARNIAENLARLGVPTVLLSAVGADGAGHRLLLQATNAGIDTSYVLIDPDGRTGACLVTLDEKGEIQTTIKDLGIINQITPRFLNDRRRLFRDAWLVMVDANLSPQALDTLFRLAQRYQTPVCADPTSPALAAKFKPFLKQLHMITPNQAEAAVLLDDKPVKSESQSIHAAKRLVALGVDIVVITMAERGVCYATSNENGRVPALQIKVVDLSGAGAALSAAIIFGLLEDFSVNEAVRLGVSAAALTIQSCETVCKTLNLEDLYNQLII